MSRSQRMLRNLPLQARMQAVKVERIGTEWRVWTAHDPAVQAGTYFALGDCGDITRVVVFLDGSEDRFTITAED